MTTNRLDRFLDHQYGRFGKRHIQVFWAMALGFLLVVVVAALTLYLQYIDATPAQGARTIIFHVLLVGLAGRFVVIPRWRSLAQPILDWLDGDRTADETVAAWQSARTLAIRMGRASAFWGFVCMVLPSVGYFAIDYDVPPSGLVLAVYAGVSTGLWACAFGIPASDLWFRPVRRDLSRAVGSPGVDLAIAARNTMGQKLMVAVPVISVLTGNTVAFMATVIDASVSEILPLVLVALVVTLSTSGLMVVFLTRSLVAPMEDLLDATLRVGDGDLAARALVTTDDETGALAVTFNRMLDRLEEVSAANLGLLEQVRQSRTRIVEASDAERRRIERNLHDGAQQRLVSLALGLRMLRDDTEDDSSERPAVDDCLDELMAGLEELRELALDLHPAVLTEEGLRPALVDLVERVRLPVALEVSDERFDDSTESTVWFVASEALANAARYSGATLASIAVRRQNGLVTLEISDNGVGGADLGSGSGLAGLADRVAAVGGTFTIDSPPERGTTIRVELPALGNGEAR